MAWNNAVVTNAGVAMLQQVLGGATFTIDNAAGGSGTVPVASLLAQTALKTQRQTFNIVGVTNETNGKKINIFITTIGLVTGYTMNQIGIWAHTANNPSALFAILQDEVGIAIPSETDIPDFALNLYTVIDFSNESEFNLTIDTTALVNVGMMNAALEDKLDLDGDGSDVTVAFTQAETRTNISAGEKLSILFGKVKKWFADLGAAAYKDIDVEGGVASHEAVTEITQTISSGAVQSPPVSFGYNHIQIPEVAASPKIEFTGFDITNLLGSDGNCEDVNKWTDVNTTHTLDATTKVFGANSIKITMTSTGSAISKTKAEMQLDDSKYYFISAYFKNGNVTSGLRLTVGGAGKSSGYVTNTTNFERVGIKLNPAETAATTNLWLYAVIGTSGQYGWVDGVMVNEISAADYALTLDQLMTKYPYVDSYATLQNPYFENRRYNLVMNGNCEDGVGYWSLFRTAGLSVLNGKFRLNVATAGGPGDYAYQDIYVKPNTIYYCKANVQSGAYIVAFDVTTGSIGIQLLSGSNKTFITDTTTTKMRIMMYGEIIGSYDFDSIMLVEGTEAPAEYKSCDLQRFVVEGRFTRDDKVKIGNGKVSGQRSVKHTAPLYGKNYDWQYSQDFTGFKSISLVLSQLPDILVDSAHGYLAGHKMVRYNGDMLTEVSGNVVNGFAVSTALYLHISDTDAGWAESVNPNNNEVKAIMNGWQATWNDGSRYILFKNRLTSSAVITSYPLGTATTLSSAASATTTITVTDVTPFKVGDYVAVVSVSGANIITNISGNNITMAVAVTASAGVIVARCDNPSGGDTRILQYCINNIAPGYEGYRLHYKLANPEPITDVNTPVHGEIWNLVPGDNYVFVDSGIVLDETINPILVDETYYTGIDAIGDTAYSPWKYKQENHIAIYKSDIYDRQFWTSAIDPSDNGYLFISNTNYDPYAIYTVDYQILKTLHAQLFGSLALSYKQSVLSTLESHSKELEQKQKHDSALDTIVDLSIYEKITNHAAYGRGCYGWATAGNFLQVVLPIHSKRVKPTVSIKFREIRYGDSSHQYNLIPLSDIQISTIQLVENLVRIDIFYAGGNATINDNIMNYGFRIWFDEVILDCRGRL